MDAATLKLYVLKYGSGATSADYVDWAVAQVQMGVDTEPVLELAGLSPPLHWSEVKDCFERSLRALGLEPPSRDKALRWRVGELIRRLADAELDASEMESDVRKLARICSELDYPNDLLVWEALAEDARDRFAFITRPEWMKAVRDQAAGSLRGMSGA